MCWFVATWEIFATHCMRKLRMVISYTMHTCNCSRHLWVSSYYSVVELTLMPFRGCRLWQKQFFILQKILISKNEVTARTLPISIATSQFSQAWRYNQRHYRRTSANGWQVGKFGDQPNECSYYNFYMWRTRSVGFIVFATSIFCSRSSLVRFSKGIFCFRWTSWGYTSSFWMVKHNYVTFPINAPGSDFFHSVFFLSQPGGSLHVPTTYLRCNDFHEDCGDSSKVQELSVSVSFCSFPSAWLFSFLRMIFATSRPK